MDSGWKQLVEKPGGRKSVESKTYKVEWLKSLVKFAEESCYEELSFQIYDNGNIAFCFDGEQVEFTENSEEFDCRTN